MSRAIERTRHVHVMSTSCTSLSRSLSILSLWLTSSLVARQRVACTKKRHEFVRACAHVHRYHAMCPRLVISFFSFRAELALDFDPSEVGEVSPDSFICRMRSHRTYTHSHSHTKAHEYAHNRRENAGQLADHPTCA